MDDSIVFRWNQFNGIRINICLGVVMWWCLARRNSYHSIYSFMIFSLFFSIFSITCQYVFFFITSYKGYVSFNALYNVSCGNSVTSLLPKRIRRRRREKIDHKSTWVVFLLPLACFQGQERKGKDGCLMQ